MKVLFCNIAEMKYYRGIVEGKDEPYSQATYVRNEHKAMEEYNFKVVTCEDGEKGCLGYFSTKGREDKDNKLHIERIEGCSNAEKEPYVEDVLVI